jgi:hypothetical protein
MVAVALAPIAGLMMVTARITNPILSVEIFNKWYSDIHVRDMVNNKFASVALRYTNYTTNSHPPASTELTMSSHYLALYNIADINFVSVPGNMDKIPLASEMLPEKDKPVTTWSDWTFTYWLPFHTYEGKNNLTERPKYVMVAKIEPTKGGEAELEEWYTKEVLYSSASTLTSL